MFRRRRIPSGVAACRTKVVPMSAVHAFIPGLRSSGESLSASVDVERYQDGLFIYKQDSVVQEVCFDVVAGEDCHSVMCSPWDLEELAVGGLFTRGVIDSSDQVASVQVDAQAKRIRVELAHDAKRREPRRPSESFCMDPEEVLSGIGRLESDSVLFHRTGGVHSAALLDGARVLCRFEDVGRHNALDKLAGWCLMNDVDTSDKVLVFSGRIPYEIISKVARLGCPVIISPGAPTSLSVDFARECGIALVGFAKNNRFNVYAASERIAKQDFAAAL